MRNFLWGVAATLILVFIVNVIWIPSQSEDSLPNDRSSIPTVQLRQGTNYLVCFHDIRDEPDRCYLSGPGFRPPATTTVDRP